MKLKITLACPSEYLYNKLITAVMKDIKQYSNDRPQRHELQNFKYNKKLSNGETVKIIITEIEENHIYSFDTITTMQKFTSKYTISYIDDKQCEVEFEEKISSDNVLRKINDSFMQLLIGPSRKQQFKQMLKQIAHDYQLEKNI